MTTNEKIDALLKTLCEMRVRSIAIGLLYSEAFGKSSDNEEELSSRHFDLDKLKDMMLDNELITNVPYDEFGVLVKASSKGFLIHEKGGWLNHIKQKRKESKKSNKRYVVQTTISAFAVLISIVSISVNIYQAKKTSKLKLQKDQMSITIDSINIQLTKIQNVAQNNKETINTLLQDSTYLRKAQSH